MYSSPFKLRVFLRSIARNYPNALLFGALIIGAVVTAWIVG